LEVVLMSATISIPVSAELSEIMRKHKAIGWESVAAKALWEKARFLEKMDLLLSKSRLTEKDALLLGRKVNKAVAKKYRELM